MSEMHLRQRGPTYNACGPLPKTKKYKNLKKQEIIYQNELNKACFQHDMVL